MAIYKMLKFKMIINKRQSKLIKFNDKRKKGIIGCGNYQFLNNNN